jgi:hypothetical protein
MAPTTSLLFNLTPREASQRVRLPEGYQLTSALCGALLLGPRACVKKREELHHEAVTACGTISHAESFERPL